MPITYTGKPAEGECRFCGAFCVYAGGAWWDFDGWQGGDAFDNAGVSFWHNHDVEWKPLPRAVYEVTAKRPRVVTR